MKSLSRLGRIGVGVGMFSLLLSGCHGQVRYHGSVQISLTAVLVAPVNDAGRPWDGTKPIPATMISDLHAPRSRSAATSFFRTLIDSTGIGSTVMAAIPWAANELLSGINAPDVVVEIYRNGKRLVRTPRVNDSYNPTWAGIYTEPLTLSDSDDIEVRAIDIDPGVFNDSEESIGVCTSRGMPMVDERGYLADQTFQCNGRLWAVVLRMRPATDSTNPR